ncbi:hypothetical protein FACS1894182_02410 [Bacteroidia bacterium]|nr:hypothetical protein FACS1894182_02410 [Bacteroidia bacterium]
MKRNVFVLAVVFFLVFTGLSTIQVLIRIKGKEDKMSWKIAQTQQNIQNYTPEMFSHKADSLYKAKDEKGFKYLLASYYGNYLQDSTHISMKNIIRSTHIDSLLNFDRGIIGNARFVEKRVNNRVKTFITDKYYSGCPANSTTIDFELQAQLNRELEKWAEKINKDTTFRMQTGSILVASHDGRIIASASFPLLYNENRYHLKYVEQSINSFPQKKGVSPFRFNSTDKDFVNISEHEQTPGSIIKPLLTYGGLSVLQEEIEMIIDIENKKTKEIKKRDLNYFLQWSVRQYAEKLFNKLYSEKQYADILKKIYEDDFDLDPYNDFNGNDFSAAYASGESNQHSFKKIVQAYIRIKTGNKMIKLDYYKPTTDTIPISLDNKRLEDLRTAMRGGLYGTANDVRTAFDNKNKKEINKEKRIRYSNFFAKTGTAQIGQEKEHNRSSSFILVADNYTVGIQLFGDVPENAKKTRAQDLFINLIDILKDYNILY